MTRTEPCSWPLAMIEDCAALDQLPSGGDPSLRSQVESMATSYLWRWTGKAFGLCEHTVRPTRTPGGSTYAGSGYWQPVLIDGTWYNVACGSCGPLCACRRPTTIRLPGPVYDIVSVVIDGAAPLPGGAYRVDDHAWLVRQDGGYWPGQDLTEPVGNAGTWTVTYRRGVPVPAGGQVAAGVLACEIAKSVIGDPECQLPQRVQTVTREGVTVGVLDTFEGLGEGRTGVWLVDAWLASMTAPPAAATVDSPDRQPAARRTTYQGP